VCETSLCLDDLRGDTKTYLIDPNKLHRVLIGRSTGAVCVRGIQDGQVRDRATRGFYINIKGGAVDLGSD